MFIVTVRDGEGNLIGDFDDIEQASSVTGIESQKIIENLGDRMMTGRIHSQTKGKDFRFFAYIAEPLDMTVVPHNKPFPETWDIIVGAFYRDFFMSEKKENIKTLMDQVFERAIFTQNCRVFGDIRREKQNSIHYFLFPVDIFSPNS